MGRKVYVIGVGMTKFEKPGSKEWDYPDMAREAGTRALEDAGIVFDAVSVRVLSGGDLELEHVEGAWME